MQSFKQRLERTDAVLSAEAEEGSCKGEEETVEDLAEAAEDGYHSFSRG